MFWDSFFSDVSAFFDTFWDNITSVIRTFNINDAIDIIIVAFLVYQGIKIIRDTRASQLVKGILVLLALFVVAQLLQLSMLTSIMFNVFSIGVFGLIVVFQQELRRALERVGRTRFHSMRFFGIHDSDEMRIEQYKNMIKKICMAAVHLSENKTGALIVFERETKLGDITRTGTVIDSIVTTELVCNIFFPNTPLHDGAVIVRDGKLYAAGCFLPLSDNDTISKSLGTRHRAALGMSESSDAVVLVVSEESGAITIAKSGVLYRWLSVDKLLELLHKERLEKSSIANQRKETKRRLNARRSLNEKITQIIKIFLKYNGA